MPFECFLLLHGDTAVQKWSVITGPSLLRVSSQQSVINVPQVLSWHSACCDKAISCILGWVQRNFGVKMVVSCFSQTKYKQQQGLTSD